jgi:hypothetical protein
MPLAFCILAHKNADQIAGLLRAISLPESVCVLHYDRRAPHREQLNIDQLTHRFPGLQVLPSRRVNWGRFSQMQVQLDMMKTAMDASSQWTHLFTISGQDFPLVSAEAMENELAGQKDQSFVSWFDPLAVASWANAEERLTRWYLDSPFLEEILRIPGVGRRLRRLMHWENTFPTLPGFRRRPPAFFKWFGGANHHILARQAVRRLLEDVECQRIAAWLKHSGHPDESFVQSALLNSPLAGTVVNDDRRAIYWNEGSASPRTLTLADLPELRAARGRGKLFARKFDSAVDNAVLQELEKDIGL